MSREIENIRVEFIEALPGRRPVNEEAVLRLMESIRRIGLRTPLSVRLVDGFKVGGDEVDGQPVLVTGAHRLEAVRRLGWEKVECFVMADGDEANARRWEIAENLHRADLTALERTDMTAEWVRLTEEADLQLRQPDANEQSKRADKRGHRKESGVRKAARELGISESDARRAIKIASLTPEAKHVAREVHLDNNRAALLQAAKAAPEEQPAILRAIAAVKEETKRTLKEKPPATPMPDPEYPEWTSDHEAAYAALVDTWDAAPEEARKAFLRRIPSRYFVEKAA